VRPWQHQYQAIFIHIPKCAGTSILEVFGHTGARDHGRWIDYQRADPANFSGYFKFSFTRCPVQRLHSTYQYFKRGGNGGRRDRALAEQIGVNRCDFHDFVFTRLTPTLIHQEVMFWEQSSFIFDQKDNLKVDFLGRIETLDDDLAAILQHLPLPPMKNVAHLNGSQFCVVPFSPEVQAQVCRLYPRDTRLLGYPSP
jgi:chondroitin 4-sulfotransferase 11